MRGANRNKQKFWYAMYDQTSEGTDEWGNIVSQYATYGDPVMTEGNISPAKGKVVSRQFGDDDLYDRVVGPLPINTPINEYAVLWIDVEPELDENGALKVNADGEIVTPWDYIVRKVGRGLPNYGSTVIAVSKVTVA